MKALRGRYFPESCRKREVWQRYQYQKWRGRASRPGQVTRLQSAPFPLWPRLQLPTLCGRGLPGGDVGVACPEALSLDIEKAWATQAQSGSEAVLPAPSPMVPPRSPGRGRARRPATAGWRASDFLVVSLGLVAVPRLAAPRCSPGQRARVQVPATTMPNPSSTSSHGPIPEEIRNLLAGKEREGGGDTGGGGAGRRAGRDRSAQPSPSAGRGGRAE